MSQRSLDFVSRVIADFNEAEGDDSAKVPFAPDTPLFGKGGKLDSLGLVNLIVLTEQKLEEEFDVSISLADERAMSMESSPFATVQTFSDYVEQRLAEAENGRP